MRQDIFGQALQDYLSGKKDATYLIQRDDGWLDEPQMVSEYFSKYPEWNECDRKIIDLVHGKTLDIGAGAGRHALYLQNKGVEVYPTDVSQGAVEVMNQQKIRNTKVMNLWHLEFPSQFFDTIILMFNGLGLAGTPERAKSMLKYFCKFTTSGGQLLMTIRDPYLTDSPVHLKYHQLNRENNKPPGQIRISIGYKDQWSARFELLFVSPQELEKITHNTGWQLAQIIQSTSIPFYGAVLQKTPNKNE